MSNSFDSNTKSPICDTETKSGTPVDYSPINRPEVPVQYEIDTAKLEENIKPGHKLKQTKAEKVKKVKTLKNRHL